MKEPRLLLCRATPRDNIERVNEWNDKLPCDVFLAKFYTEYKAYMQMRDYFLKWEYDYMVLATDDIIVKPEHIEQLKKDLTEIPYPVLCGIMNTDQIDYAKEDGNLAITYELPVKDRQLRDWTNHWIRKNKLPDGPIFKVAFNGFSLMAIRRDVIRDHIFTTDGVFRGTGVEFGASVDFVFCWYCQENNISVMVDKRISLEHLRESGTQQVGHRNPENVFIQHYTEKQRMDVEYLKSCYENYNKQGKSGYQYINEFLEALYHVVVRE